MAAITFAEVLKFEEILKFNPYHDSLGRFASSNGGKFYATPGKSRSHDLAIEREKKRQEENKPKPAPKPAPKTKPKPEQKPAPKQAPVEAKELKTDEEYDEYASHYKTWEKSLTGAERDAVAFYQVGSFGFNQKLRYPDDPYDSDSWGEQATAKQYKALDSALSKSTIHQDTTVYRAISDADALGDVSKLVGKTIVDKGYASTSLSRESATGYGEGIICKIKVPKGSKAAYVSGIDGTGGVDMTWNREVLLPRNAKMKITKVTPKVTEYKTYNGGTYKETSWEVEMEYEG